ncbi:MAG TPA: UTRA domain-containing protein, partial [Chloroflexota bacterium]|nr:UTRA domain-containing protein [Chloroflexota bacterium]
LAAAYRETVTAASVPSDVAQVLGLAEGAPILVSRRTTATADGHPFLYDEAHLPPDRIQVAIARQGTRCTINLAPVFPVSETAPLPPGVVLPLPS